MKDGLISFFEFHSLEKDKQGAGKAYSAGEKIRRDIDLVPTRGISNPSILRYMALKLLDLDGGYRQW